jgi:L-ascorbate metabolism protein UlaG (beta-lactamase superfamily)
MKRRQLMRYVGAGALTAFGSTVLSSIQAAEAQSGGGSVTIQYLGHTCFLFSGGGPRVLVNPYRSLGCTAGLPAPRVATDLVLISSQLLDEGAVELVPGNPRLLYEAGAYQVDGKQIQGIRTEHDRVGGRRFGFNVAWRWKQGGVDILHLGGAAAPITVEQKILMGTPDVVLIPVGNGAKAYTPEEAKQAIAVLNPKLVIPTHYLTPAANKAACDLVPVDTFLSLMSGTSVRRVGKTFTLRAADLSKGGTAIALMG